MDGQFFKKVYTRLTALTSLNHSILRLWLLVSVTLQKRVKFCPIATLRTSLVGHLPDAPSNEISIEGNGGTSVGATARVVRKWENI